MPCCNISALVCAAWAPAFRSACVSESIGNAGIVHFSCQGWKPRWCLRCLHSRTQSCIAVAARLASSFCTSRQGNEMQLRMHQHARSMTRPLSRATAPWARVASIASATGRTREAPYRRMSSIASATCRMRCAICTTADTGCHTTYSLQVNVGPDSPALQIPKPWREKLEHVLSLQPPLW